ncbi:MAG: hypothetical protein IJ199_05005 [Prevotella sp.]|nr:hypothetical protein [Prevotella sp.]
MKKKFFALAVAAMAVLGAQAQNMVNGHEYVDLGLPSGTMWATVNVGASSPTDKGNDYYCSSSSNDNIKFVHDWGDGWVLPTYSQFEELFSNCTIESDKTTYVKLVSKINSNSITFRAETLTEYNVDYCYTSSLRAAFSSPGYYNSDCYSYDLVYGGRTFVEEHAPARLVLEPFTISSIPDDWKVNGMTPKDGKLTFARGKIVTVTPANIPVGQKIKSIKVIPTE